MGSFPWQARALEANPRLTAGVLHDLNSNPSLTFDDGQFDAVLCTVSLEYLGQPLDVFADVARVLKPGGLFVVSFSNRWFPPKAIRIWKELHELERLGLVTEYPCSPKGSATFIHVLQNIAPPVLPDNPNQAEIAPRSGVNAAAGVKLD